MQYTFRDTGNYTFAGHVDPVIDTYTLEWGEDPVLAVRGSVFAISGESAVTIEYTHVLGSCSSSVLAHDVETFAVTQAHVLSVDDTVFSHISESVDLTQWHDLAVNNATIGHDIIFHVPPWMENILDDVVLTDGQIISDNTVMGLANNLYLQQQHLLRDMADSDIGHSVGQDVLLTQNQFIIVDNASLAHLCETFSVEQVQALIVHSASHAHTVEALLDIIEHKTLALADSGIAHTVDGDLGITQVHNITPDGSVIGHQVGSDITLSQWHNLQVSSALHAHGVGSVELFSGIIIDVDTGTFTQGADGVSLTQGQVIGEVADSGLGHSVDPISITQVHTLSVSDATHAHSVAQDLYLGVMLAVANSFIGHDASSITISLSGYLLDVNDSAMSQDVTTTVLSQVHNLIVSNVTQAQTVDGLLQLLGPSLLGDITDPSIESATVRRSMLSVTCDRDMTSVTIKRTFGDV